MVRTDGTTQEYLRRMLKKAVQQGRSERRGEAYASPYVEPLSDARTPLADFFSILLEARRVCLSQGRLYHRLCQVVGEPVVQRSEYCSESLGIDK